MSYFLKKTQNSKGLYLQIYESYYVSGKGTRNRCYKTIGYEDDLIKKGISNPIESIQAEVKHLNQKCKENTEKEINDLPPVKNLGFFLLKIMLDKLDIDDELEDLYSKHKSRAKDSYLFRQLIYSLALLPTTHDMYMNNILALLYGHNDVNPVDIKKTLNNIGSNQQDYINILNRAIDKTFKRDTGLIYYDCKNYFLHIVFTSNENDFYDNPILQKLIFFDNNIIPIGMSFHLFNNNENIINTDPFELFDESQISSFKLIKISYSREDLLKNLKKNLTNPHYGYLFLKKLSESTLNPDRKNFVIKSDSNLNKWESFKIDNDKYYHKSIKIKDSDGNVSDYNTYEYSYKLYPNAPKYELIHTKEKKLVLYDCNLANKQKRQLLDTIEEIKVAINHKDIEVSKFGAFAKFIKGITKNIDGRNQYIAEKIDMDAVNNELNYCGYIMIASSEKDSTANELIKKNAELHAIKNEFEIAKDIIIKHKEFFNSRNMMIGYLTICYFLVTLSMLLSKYIFKGKVSMNRVLSFIKEFNIVEYEDGKYINTSPNNKDFNYIRDRIGSDTLKKLNLTDKDVKEILKLKL